MRRVESGWDVAMPQWHPARDLSIWCAKVEQP
jgi:hypothetical protein